MFLSIVESFVALFLSSVNRNDVPGGFGRGDVDHIQTMCVRRAVRIVLTERNAAGSAVDQADSVDFKFCGPVAMPGEDSGDTIVGKKFQILGAVRLREVGIGVLFVKMSTPQGNDGKRICGRLPARVP